MNLTHVYVWNWRRLRLEAIAITYQQYQDFLWLKRVVGRAEAECFVRRVGSK